MTDDPLNFDAAFEALTGTPPFPWQRRLFDAMRRGEFPGLDLPTGLGKTSAVVCWLLALAAGAPVPRRLVYVVNRRTIVDQVTAVAERLHRRLREADDPILKDLRRQLCALSDRPETDADGALAISTLRGEFADNGEWRSDPARPSIIVGTPDLIGSDLLFSGYRTGRSSLALHAGLLGHDALVLHDEAHLSRPFQVLLETIAAMQLGADDSRPLRVMALSATGGGTGGTRLTLDADDLANGTVSRRYHAAKWLKLHELADATPKALAARLAELALAHEAENARVIVYVRRPADAAAVAELIGRHKGVGAGRVALLTGQIRGKERDALAESDVLGALQGGGPADKTVYLVSTSAGEVGADFDADHLVCDLTAADALVQRLGRVNRRGDRADSRIDLVVADDPAESGESSGKSSGPSPRALARAATLALLRSLPADADGHVRAGPFETRERWGLAAEHAEPAPEVLPLTPQMVAALSLTSIKPGAWPLPPDVATLIHGFVDELPEATLAWRAEVPELIEHRLRPEDLSRVARDVLRAFPVRSAERVGVPALAAAEFVRDRAKVLAKGESPKSHVGLLVGRDGVERLALDADVKPSDLAFKTLLLPPAFGGLTDQGVLDPKANAPEGRSLDVADVASGEGRRRRFYLHGVADGQWECRPPVKPGEDPERQSKPKWLESIRETGLGRIATVALRSEEESVYGLELVLADVRSEGRRNSSKRPTVEKHNGQVAAEARRVAGRLGLPPASADAVADAAARHDDGKRRDLWQGYIGNFDPAVRYAKSKGDRWCDWRNLRGYRHEYGSLLDAIAAGVRDDLTLHLIAAHHGHARPHFDHPFDPEGPDAPPELGSPHAVAVRFDRLQRAHGPWGLAWLESLLMAADRRVSRATRGGRR